MALLDVWSSPGILAAPLNEMIISIQEPWMVLDVADNKINVLIYTGAITLPWSLTLGRFHLKTPLWLQLWKVSHSLLHWISHLPMWTPFDFTCLFFVVPECPTTPPERDLLGSLGAMLQLWHHEQSLFLILTRTKQLKNKGLFPVLSFAQYTLQVGMKKSLWRL